MTAEVAIFNKSAIALAADSAVSIEGVESSKVYNNAEKLFALTKHYPVAIMIYARNELQGVPWELIIKAYRKELGLTSFATIREYKDSFLDFARRFYFNIPQKSRDNWLKYSIQSIVDSTAELLSDRVTDLEEEIESADNIRDIKPIDLFDIEVDNLIELYEEAPNFEGLSEDTLDDSSLKFLNYAYDILFEMIDVSKLTLADKDDWSSTCQKFQLLCKKRLVKQDPFFDGITGLVFAGYGDTDYFPVLIECAVYGAINNKIKVNDVSSSGEEEVMTSGIKAFAQKEEVSTFMEGISNSQRKNVGYNVQEVFEERNNVIRDLIVEYVPKEKQKKLLDKYEEKFLDQLHNFEVSVNDYTMENHINKVLRMVEHLPKNELAYMAESMVNLTAFKRKVSNESDSVGGPIDVAVISKGDGLVWIKRKHYFPQELNSQYGPKLN
ncbi:hypothetical protein NMR99_000177 [Vibrio navarrensis]|nr:hypothetical protein [Vibrio navarrensis]